MLSLVFAITLSQLQGSDTNGIEPSFAYVLQAEGIGSTRALSIARLARSDRDWIILDTSFDGSDAGRWRRSELRRIRRSHPNRRVIAYVSIGEAETYRAYWKAAWDPDEDGIPAEGAPDWLLGENPIWEGNYRVRYWDPAWQRIILRRIRSAMRQGFDGVYLDIVDAYETFETDPGSETWIDNRINPETKQSYRNDMIGFVRRVKRTASRKRRDCLVIPQNGAALLEQRSYRQLVSAIGVEDLFTNGQERQPQPETNYILKSLRLLDEENKPVLSVDYARNRRLAETAAKQATKNGFSHINTNRQLNQH